MMPPERVDLAHHVSFGESAHRRVAGHLADGVGVLSEHQRFAAKSRRRHRRLDSGMARANDDHVVGLGILELAHATIRKTRRLASALPAPRDRENLVATNKNTTA